MCAQKSGKEIREWTSLHVTIFTSFMLMCQNDGAQAVHRLMFHQLS